MSSTSPAPAELLAATLFAVALVHTFAASQLERLGHRFPRHAGLFHLLGEVEVVFGFWAIVLVLGLAVLQGGASALEYTESLQYTEPLFVFVVMVIAGTRPVLQAVLAGTSAVARLAPVPTPLASAWLGLAVVPLAGSLITEPAAMTVAALMLRPLVFNAQVPARARYFALGVLFVNVSIGGTLTAYAAPPVLMVAHVWNWSSAFMLETFGWKAALAVLINATLAAVVLRRHVTAAAAAQVPRVPVPMPVMLVHFAFLAAVVLLAHHPIAFIGLFLMFLGFTQAYDRHQDRLVLREALLVGFFLAGLVVLGGLQAWWLKPIVSGLGPRALYLGAAGLTALTDNAALTYLGSLIPELSEAARYSLVAGAVAGGGLTVLANAPNPAGVALLRRGFEDESIGALRLLLGAAIPTAVALVALAL